MSKKKVWLSVRSIPKEKNKIIEVLGSDDASCDELDVFKVVYEKSVNSFITPSGWIVTPFAWREL